MSIDKRNLADYTESDELDHEQAKARIRNVLVGRDYDNRLSARELSERCPGVSTSTVRDLVAEVRRDYNVAIYSRGSGYWHIQDGSELDEAIGRINDQIATKEETKRELAEAFNRSRR